MNKILPVISLFILMNSFYYLMGQDPVMANFYAGKLNLNPALAGTEGPATVSLGYRNQWPNSGSSYITYQASYDQYIEKLHGGVGVKVMNDKQGGGVFNYYNVDFIYNYQFRATRKLSLSGGLQAGFGQRSFDGSSLLFRDMFDPVTGNFTKVTQENTDRAPIFFPDFATGVFATYLNLYGGVSVHHLLRPVITQRSDPNGAIPRKYSLHAGALLPVIDKSIGHQIMLISPNFVFVQQADIQQINYGLDAIYNDLLVGLWVRHDMKFNYGNLIFSAGYQAVNWRLRYSYDIRLSSPQVQLPNMGAHEFTLVLIYRGSENRKGFGAIKCPKF
ncbi:MAG TPA: PorP/SprF family type IX secretion system membrane protein [Bacteroidales bacterium]|nr:PorP/SprF family type IX secretion system membrane protein [Bacteroidales bacterium]